MVLEALFVVWENTFGIKTGGGHHKLWFDTIYNDIGLTWGALQAKKGPERGQKGPKLYFEASSGFVYYLRCYFEFKIGEEYHKIQSDTIFIDIYSIWGGLCIKKGTKRVKKSQICVSRLLEALFVVTEKYSQAKTDGGHQKN